MAESCVAHVRGCRCIVPRAERVDRAALALFVAQAATWDVPEPAARMEWDGDPELRDFWRGQVDIVLKAYKGGRVRS